MKDDNKERRSQGMLLNFILCYGGDYLTPASIPWLDPVEAQRLIEASKNRRNHDPR